MGRNSIPTGAVRYWLVVAVLLIGGLAGCSVSVPARPQPPTEDFSALAPILVPDSPYALPSVPITAENADRASLVGEMAGLGRPSTLASAPDGRVLAVGTSRGVYLYLLGVTQLGPNWVIPTAIYGVFWPITRHMWGSLPANCVSPIYTTRRRWHSDAFWKRLL
jgi:hypothetical protein